MLPRALNTYITYHFLYYLLFQDRVNVLDFDMNKHKKNAVGSIATL